MVLVQDNFIWLPLGDKTKYGFLVTSGVYFLEKYDGLSESVAFAQNWGILQTRIEQRIDHMKMNSDHFEIQKWMSQTVRVEKVDEKMG